MSSLDLDALANAEIGRITAALEGSPVKRRLRGAYAPFTLNKVDFVRVFEQLVENYQQAVSDLIKGGSPLPLRKICVILNDFVLEHQEFIDEPVMGEVEAFLRESIGRSERKPSSSHEKSGDAVEDNSEGSAPLPGDNSSSSGDEECRYEGLSLEMPNSGAADREELSLEALSSGATDLDEAAAWLALEKMSLIRVEK